MSAPRLILASGSPSRRNILDSAGLAYSVVVSDVDEDAVVDAATSQEELTPAEIALLLAQAKAEDVASRPGSRGALVLGCDSVFEFDGQRFGKPYEPAVALQRWQQMRGHSGILHTGHWLVNAATAISTTEHSWLGMAGTLGTGQHLGVPSNTLESAGETVSSSVHFAEPTDAELRSYIATGEPLLCAGGFTLEARGSAFINRVEGDPQAVIGLSPAALRRLMSALNYELSDLWLAAAGSQKTQHNPITPERDSSS